MGIVNTKPTGNNAQGDAKGFANIYHVTETTDDKGNKIQALASLGGIPIPAKGLKRMPVSANATDQDYIDLAGNSNAFRDYIENAMDELLETGQPGDVKWIGNGDIRIQLRYPKDEDQAVVPVEKKSDFGSLETTTSASDGQGGAASKEAKPTADATKQAA